MGSKDAHPNCTVAFAKRLEPATASVRAQAQALAVGDAAGGRRADERYVRHSGRVAVADGEKVAGHDGIAGGSAWRSEAAAADRDRRARTGCGLERQRRRSESEERNLKN